jgi:hypothetical protein
MIVLVVLGRIALVYALVWALQETSALVLAETTDTPYAWAWPSPWNCPDATAYQWSLPRCVKR